MCCVLKVVAQRVIPRGEHAKVALDFHLYLWDFGWMSGPVLGLQQCYEEGKKENDFCELFLMQF